MMIERKVARASYNGKQEDFDKFWPLPDSIKAAGVGKTFVWPEDPGEFKKRMEAAHNIKIG